MAGVYKRASDKARGKAGKFTCWWIGADKQKHSCVGTTNKLESEQIAKAKEYQALQVHLGLVDPAEQTRLASASRPIADHLEDYRLDLTARRDTPLHITNTISAIRRLLEDAKIKFIGEVTPDKVQTALGKIRGRGRSARTCNHALKATKTFVRWLTDSDRLREYPAGLAKIETYPEASDRKRVRRPLSLEEIGRLLSTTEQAKPFVTSYASRHGQPVTTMSGPDRAMCYRLALGTGFRAEEVRTLTPEQFTLGDNPTITVRACYSKRGKRTGRDDVQPIRGDLAAELQRWLKGKPPGKPVFPLSVFRNTKMLYADLAAAEIEQEVDGKIIDFHSFRHTYITHLVASKANLEVVRMLARHHSITFTIDRYTTFEGKDMRAAIEDASKTPLGLTSIPDEA